MTAFPMVLGWILIPFDSRSQEVVPRSFKPMQRPVFDPASHADRARDNLDRFIADALEEAELKPNANADRATLLRRVAFDLTGLPPTQPEFHHLTLPAFA